MQVAHFLLKFDDISTTTVLIKIKYKGCNRFYVSKKCKLNTLPLSLRKLATSMLNDIVTQSTAKHNKTCVNGQMKIMITDVRNATYICSSSSSSNNKKKAKHRKYFTKLKCLTLNIEKVC